MMMVKQLVLFAGRPNLETQIERFLNTPAPDIWSFIDQKLGHARNTQDAIVLLYVATKGEIETSVMTMRKLLLKGIESGELQSENLLNIVLVKRGRPKIKKQAKPNANRFLAWKGDAWASKVE